MPRKSMRKLRKYSRYHKRGGQYGSAYPAPNPASYSSATSYQEAVNGTGLDQFNRVFDIKGPDGAYPSNIIVGAQGQNIGPNPINNGASLKGGSRRKKGGFWSQVLNHAIVPFSLFGMQQSYKRPKRNDHKYTKKTRKY